jgi:hypothetical protein
MNISNRSVMVIRTRYKHVVHLCVTLIRAIMISGRESRIKPEKRFLFTDNPCIP